jgi:hypothetical protein
MIAAGFGDWWFPIRELQNGQKNRFRCKQKKCNPAVIDLSLVDRLKIGCETGADDTRGDETADKSIRGASG